MSDDIDNISLFQPTNFKLTIDRKNYRATEMFCNSVTHPGASVGAAIAPEKRLKIPLPGDTLTFGELSVMILLDEDFNSYKELYNWLLRHVNMSHTTQYEAVQNNSIPSICDIIITAMTNHNNANQRIRYIDAFPTNIGDINFVAGTSDTNLAFPASFAFAYFEIL